MHRVRLIHWNEAEAEERAERLRSAGHEVACQWLDSVGLRELRGDPPSAVVIDLGRLPSQGRDVALTLRKYKSTRHLPLIFVGGAPDKVASIKGLLPDAVYAEWNDIQTALEVGIASPPVDPVVMQSLFDVYAGTPLPKKLGIKANAVVALVGAPEGLEETLGELPEGVSLRRQASDQANITLWFPESKVDLERRAMEMSAYSDQGGLWIAWPKKASGVSSDLSQAVVRKVGLASEMVDFKICSIDATWSGLRFTRRKREAG